jgi:hypothetical protein
MAKETTKMKINRNAVKAYALECSTAMRAGKFTRVSEGFLSDIEMEVESAIRGINQTAPIDRQPRPLDDIEFVHPAAVMEAVVRAINNRVKIVIARKVHRLPSVGVTIVGV